MTVTTECFDPYRKMYHGIGMNVGLCCNVQQGKSLSVHAPSARKRRAGQDRLVKNLAGIHMCPSENIFKVPAP